MDLGIKGRTAIVCASSRGLGRGCAMELARAGCRVVVNGRDAGQLARSAEDIRSETEAEVIARANDSEYGLVAYVVTENGARQMRLGRVLEYGMVAINRVKITGEPMMQVDFTHHGEHGDHNVSGMVTTAQRIINALPAVVDAQPGIVRALDLPLVTGRGLVSST